MRLQERLDDPTKHWKFAAGDLECAKQWDAYQQAYESAIAATGTPWAPWTIVPADSKTHRNLMIARAIDGRSKAEAALPAGQPGAGRDPRQNEFQRRHPVTDLSAEYQALAAYRPTNKVRFVTAASLFDGHDAAINIMRRILQGHGREVIHLGHNRSVDEVVTAALQEDAQGIALSSYQGPRRVLSSTWSTCCAQRGGAHIQVFGGGGGVIVPGRDRRAAGLRRGASTAPKTASAWAWRG